MSLVIKVLLSVILFVQFSFAETILFYQNPKVKNAVEFMGNQPTVDEVAKMIAFNKMDAQALITIRNFLNEKKIAAQTDHVIVDLTGNKLMIAGLKYALVIANSDKLKISYDGENVELKNPNDVAQTFKDIEAFFAQKVGKHNATKYLLFGLSISPQKQAEAVYSCRTSLRWQFLLSRAGFILWWNSTSKKGLEEWPFEVGNFGKAVDINCEAGNLHVCTCGNEKLIFLTNSEGSASDKVCANEETTCNRYFGAGGW